MILPSLHLHSIYSPDGLIRIPDLIKLYKQNNINFASVTDHGNIVCLGEHYFTCKESGIKPILGMEAYIGTKGEKTYFHQLIIAKNKKGFDNLVKLNNFSYLENFYYRPLLTLEKLFEHSEGLIVTTTCIKSLFNQKLIKGEKIDDILCKFKEVFGENFLIELVAINYDLQKEVNRKLLEYSKKYKIEIIITTDSHFIYPEQEKQYKSIVKITKGYETDASDLYIKTEKEVAEILEIPDIKKYIKNIYALVEKIENIDLYYNNSIPQKYSRRELIEIAKKNFESMNVPDKEKYRQRLNYEVKVFDQTDSWNYISLCYDIVKFCDDNGITRGYGRGSAASSLFFYVLGLTKIDPIKHGLIFERFLSPNRKAKLLYE